MEAGRRTDRLGPGNGPVNVPELLQEWVHGLTATTGADLFAVTGIIGCVVMPHNFVSAFGHLSIPTGSTRDEATVRLAVHLSSWGTRCPGVVDVF